MVKLSYIEFIHIFLPNLKNRIDACKSPLVNERGMIPEYFAAYLATPRVPGNVPSRLVVTSTSPPERHVVGLCGNLWEPSTYRISGHTGPLMLPIRRYRPFPAITDLDYDTILRRNWPQKKST